MSHLSGESREQIRYFSLEDCIGEESIVRVIDRFIEIQDFLKLGFSNVIPSDVGRPSYPPKALAKLYVYGYENGIRSSRKLERETLRNIEVMWLVNELKPDYKTIAEFRKNNIRPLQKLFREFIKLCKSWELIGGEIVAIDGTKIKASNNKKTNFSRKKLEDRIARLDERINEYLNQMDSNDMHEEKEIIDTSKVLKELNDRKEKYEKYLEKLEETGENEISEVDPDARLMGNNRGGVDVCYNIQSAVDEKHHIAVAMDVVKSPVDHGQLGRMVNNVQKTLKIKRFIVVADKGYYNGEDLKRCKKYKVNTIVAKQKPSDSKEQPKEFNSDKFIYTKETDTFTCPAAKTLYPHNKKTAKRRNFYNKTACENCPNKQLCTGGKTPYRTVTRSQYGDIYDEVDKRTKENMHLYKLRQQIAEHPFGTIKHTLNGGYFLLRTRRKVRAEVALLFLAYNLKRALKVLGFKEIMARLNAFSSCFSLILCRFRNIFLDFGKLPDFKLN